MPRRSTVGGALEMFSFSLPLPLRGQSNTVDRVLNSTLSPVWTVLSDPLWLFLIMCMQYNKLLKLEDTQTLRSRDVTRCIAQNLPFQQILSTLDSPTGLPSWQRDWTGPIMHIVLFLVSHFNCLFILCGRLSWLPVSFLLHVKYTLSYRIVSYMSI